MVSQLENPEMHNVLFSSQSDCYSLKVPEVSLTVTCASQLLDFFDTCPFDSNLKAQNGAYEPLAKDVISIHKQNS